MAWLRRPKVPLSHNNPRGVPCAGALVWGKSPAKQIRRECSICGYREVWVDKAKRWSSKPFADKPGQEDWVNST